IRGLPMIEHIRRRVSMCDMLDQVIVATCDEEIRKVVEAENGTVVMTLDSHERCTDRVAEVIEKIETDGYFRVRVMLCG
ncbi:MAG: cytidylyltransferase domain-containing protein, partial [Candidatus Anammoxibacter sp.]